MVVDHAQNTIELRRLFLAQIPADFADWLDFVAISALLAFGWQSDPIIFAYLAVSMGLPYVIVGPFAGALVDRLDLRTVMIWSNLGRAMATIALAFAPNWGVLLFIVVLRSTVDTFYSPAKQAAIQALANVDELPRANGISHAINQTSKIAGPAIGGLLMIWISPQSVFLCNALVSILAFVATIRLSSEIRKSPDPVTREGLATEILAGWREVVGNKLLGRALLLMAGAYFAMFFYDTLLPVMTRELGFTEKTLGLAIAGAGIGGVAGALLIGLLPDFKNPFRWIGFGFLTSGLVVTGVGLVEVLNWPIQVVQYIALFTIAGMATAAVIVPIRSIIQRETPPENIAKVTALSQASNTVALLIAPFIGAFLAQLASVGWALICGGVLFLALALRTLIQRNGS